jgi:hypothetical protein
MYNQNIAAEKNFVWFADHQTANTSTFWLIEKINKQLHVLNLFVTFKKKVAFPNKNEDNKRD